MYKVNVHKEGMMTSLTAKKGEVLYRLLRRHGFMVYSPCGGLGTCGKCSVYVKEQGEKISCQYHVNESLEVILPNLEEARILTTQHSLTRELSYDPGPVLNLSSHPYGMAIDLGTTTLVSYLVNLLQGSLIETHSMLNPQSSFGADVITRIHYASTVPGGLQELQHAIISALNVQAHHFTNFLRFSYDDLVKITITGNNTMLHLLLGADPYSMGQAPYRPGFTTKQVRKGKDLGIHCHPEAEIILLPSVSAFVGADILAGLGSIRPMEAYKNYLFMDLGTNGELALVTPDAIWCCATAAGPVFEGAGISCGMGGVAGAIAAFSSGDYRVIGNEMPRGLCGSGLVDVVAFLLDSGFIDPTGLMPEPYAIVPENLSGTGKTISIDQRDVRQFQLAKSAIATGIIILLKQAGLTFDDLDALFLAGGFGNYLNVECAVKTGLIPLSMKEKVVNLGNTSGTGALLALRSTSFEAVLESILCHTRHIELSEDEDFAIEFALNMDFQVVDDRFQ
jgi:uncharacterized 2Fe-2S/4Fe-4S cluster protein (DUF4445 family)